MAAWAMLEQITEPGELTDVSCSKLMLADAETDMHTALLETLSGGITHRHLLRRGQGRRKRTEEAAHCEWSQTGRRWKICWKGPRVPAVVQYLP